MTALLSYRQFAKDWGFDHVTSSPHYARSNGLVERQIETIKKDTYQSERNRSRSQIGTVKSTVYS